MANDHDEAFRQGKRQAVLNMLAHFLGELHGDKDPRVEYARLLAERMETIGKLREICEVHGDNDWGDTLHLADVVEKHLGRHLD